MQEVDLREKDLKTLVAIFRRFPSVCEVRVYGSRASCHAKRASDIDLAIFAPSIRPMEWSDLCEALENAPIIYEIDIVRPDRLPEGGLKEKIERESILIYAAEDDEASFRVAK